MRLFQTVDEFYMHRCTELARLGASAAEAGPLLGVVLTDIRHQKIATGYTGHKAASA